MMGWAHTKKETPLNRAGSRNARGRFPANVLGLCELVRVCGAALAEALPPKPQFPPLSVEGLLAAY